MKHKLTIITLLLLLPITAFAGELTKSDITAIKKVGKVAESVMEYRQVGGSLSKMLEWVQDNVPDAAVRRLSKQVIIDAYNTPVYASKAAKHNAATRFRNKWEKAMTDALKKRE